MPSKQKDGCGFLNPPENGNVRHKGTKVGSKAVYSCKRGYQLKGEHERKCQYNGSWSGDEPQCKPGKLDERISCELIHS